MSLHMCITCVCVCACVRAFMREWDVNSNVNIMFVCYSHMTLTWLCIVHSLVHPRSLSSRLLELTLTDILCHLH